MGNDPPWLPLDRDGEIHLDALEELYRHLTAETATVLVESDRTNRTAAHRSTAKSTHASNAGTTPQRGKLQRPTIDEYRRWQDDFDTNIAARLIDLELTDRVLFLLQGAVLLHPRSRKLFSRPRPLHSLLKAIESKDHGSEARCTAVNTLVCCLADYPINTRRLESIDGLARLSACFKVADRQLQLRLLEFFYFYLSDEVGQGAMATKDKQKLLEKHLDHVDALVEDLHLYRPFDLA